MIITSALCLFTFMLYNFLGTYAITQNNKNLSNRIFSVIAVIFSFWSLSAFLRSNFSSISVILIWRLASLFAWSFGSSSILLFVISLVRQKKFQKSNYKIFYIYLPAIIIASIAIPYIVKFPVVTSYKIPRFIDNYVAPLYYLSHLVISILLLFRWFKKAETKREKKQSKIVYLTLLLTTILVFLYSDILPLFLGKNLPFLLPIFPIIWILGMWISITRYRLLEFKPNIAVREIMDNILEGIIMIDNKGRIVEVNKNVQKLLFLKEENLKEISVSKLFGKNINLTDKIQKCLSGKLKLVQEEIEFIQSEIKKSIFLRLMATPVTTTENEVIGLVISVQDLTLERKNTVYAMAITANHEINQPLTIAKGNLQMLEQQINYNKIKGLSKTAANYLDAALKSLTRIEKILVKYRKAREFTLENYTKGVKMIHFESN